MAIGTVEMSGHRMLAAAPGPVTEYNIRDENQFSLVSTGWISLWLSQYWFYEHQKFITHKLISRASSQHTRREEILRFRISSAIRPVTVTRTTVGGKISAKTRPNMHTLACFSSCLLLPSRSTPSSVSPENNSTEKWVNYISAWIASLVVHSLLQAPTATTKKYFLTQVPPK